jgi:hypothetical protein
MNKQALIVVLLLFVLFFVPWGSSSDIQIYTKKIDHSVLPQKYTIEVYASPHDLPKYPTTLICSVYSISEQVFTKTRNVKIKQLINVTYIQINDKNDFNKPVCKISQDGYNNAFHVHGYVTKISKNRGTIIDMDGLPEYAEYKHLLINVTMIDDSGSCISSQKLLDSGYREIKKEPKKTNIKNNRCGLVTN